MDERVTIETKSLMSTTRAAKYLGWNRVRLWRKAQRGELTTFRFEGKYLYFLASEIMALRLSNSK
ncbi:hypothetical protein ES708_17483 [subsurface metagenome]